MLNARPHGAMIAPLKTMNFVVIVALSALFVFQKCMNSSKNHTSPAESKSVITQVRDLSRDDYGRLEASLLRKVLPIKVDSFLSIVGVRYDNEIIHVTQKRNDDMGPRRFSLNVRYTHEKSRKKLCETPALARFLEQGIKIKYYYVNERGSLLAEELFTPEECST